MSPGALSRVTSLEFPETNANETLSPTGTTATNLGVVIMEFRPDELTFPEASFFHFLHQFCMVTIVRAIVRPDIERGLGVARQNRQTYIVVFAVTGDSMV